MISKSRKANILGMLNDEIEVVAEDVMEGTKELLRNAITEESEVVSIYYGADTAEEDAKELSAFIEEEFPDCEVEVQDGGQPCITTLFLLNKNNKTKWGDS